MRRIIEALSLICLTSTVYADISVPTFNGGWEATIAGLYLNASSNGLSYHTQSLTPDPINLLDFDVATGNSKSADLGYQWGFQLGVGYLFPNSANDFQIDWLHFDTGTQNGPTFRQSPTYINDFGGGLYDVVTNNSVDSGQAKLRDDSIDVDFGQFINLSSSLSLRLFAGLRYADLDQYFLTQSSFVTVETDPNTDQSAGYNSFATADLESQFIGIGPLLGLNGNYAINKNWAIEADGDSALLVGNERNQGVFTITQATSFVNESGNASQSVPSFSQIHVVPALDGKLGVNYSHVINNIQFDLAGGYQVTEYFNAFDRINSDSASFFSENNSILPYGGTFAPIPVTTHTNNLTIDGPYLSLTVKA